MGCGRIAAGLALTRSAGSGPSPAHTAIGAGRNPGERCERGGRCERHGQTR